MTCEICNTQTATMWVQPKPKVNSDKRVNVIFLSCDDCGPQAGYKTLAPLTANIRSRD